MKEVFEKITDRLVKKIKPLHNANWNVAMEEAIEIVNQVADECKDKYVNIGAYNQVAWERDIAIKQLHELGYEFGQKIDGKDTNVGTNADHIRNLTDEELANTLIHFDSCDICSSCHAAEDCMCTIEEEKEKVVKWLQEPKGEK